MSLTDKKVSCLNLNVSKTINKRFLNVFLFFQFSHIEGSNEKQHDSNFYRRTTRFKYFMQKQHVSLRFTEKKHVSARFNEN